MKTINLNIIAALTFMLSCGPATEPRETWYDAKETQLREIFNVSKEPPYLKEGNYKKYSRDGRLLENFNFKNGKKDGECIKYFSDTEKEEMPSEVENYIAGRLNGEYISYYKNGNMKENGEFEDDTINGRFKEYFENGTLSRDYFVEKGLLNGLFKKYYENGNLELKFMTRDNKKDGEYIEYDENENKIIECHLKKGLLDGEYIEFTEDGEIKSRTMYKNGAVVNEYKPKSDEEAKIISEKYVGEYVGSEGGDCSTKYTLAENNNLFNMYSQGICIPYDTGWSKETQTNKLTFNTKTNDISFTEGNTNWYGKFVERNDKKGYDLILSYSNGNNDYEINFEKLIEK